MKRLCALKQRPPEKPFSVHLADTDELPRHVKQVPFAGRRLIERFWPGPLTIVFGRAPKAVGVRLPAHEVALAFIRACRVPVVAPSANLAGEKSAASAAEVPVALAVSPAAALARRAVGQVVSVLAVEDRGDSGLGEVSSFEPIVTARTTPAWSVKT